MRFAMAWWSKPPLLVSIVLCTVVGLAVSGRDADDSRLEVFHTADAGEGADDAPIETERRGDHGSLDRSTSGSTGQLHKHTKRTMPKLPALDGIRWYGKDQREQELPKPSRPAGMQSSDSSRGNIGHAQRSSYSSLASMNAPASNADNALEAIANMGDVVKRAAKAKQITADTARKSAAIAKALQLLVSAQQRVSAALEKGDPLIKPNDVLGASFTEDLRQALKEAGAMSTHARTEEVPKEDSGEDSGASLIALNSSAREHGGPLTQGRGGSDQLSRKLKTKISELTTSSKESPIRRLTGST
mmetsp:Transcript_74592/g.136307  ORF Transcript_74592/g.136307 Transcript_74592/m.136307 type:complete len:302 (+) Transcript_74592:68-973(+)